MTDLEKYENEMPFIFGQMREKDVYKNDLREDGIYNPDLYFSEGRLRILQVYKEIHGKKGDDWAPIYFKYRYKQKNGEDAGMEEGNSVSNPTCPVWREMLGIDPKPNGAGKGPKVKGIGYINLRKLPGEETTNIKELIGFFKTDYEQSNKGTDESLIELLFRQIRICNADVIVFGGTFGIIWELLTLQEKKPESIFKRIGRDIYSDFEPALRFIPEKGLSFWLTEGDLFGDRNPFIVQIYHPSRPPYNFLYPYIKYAYSQYKKHLENVTKQ